MNKPLKEYERRAESNGYMLCILIFCELFMSFSFLGYIHIEPISITFVYIPVMLAGCLLGPKEATILGAVFGLASMWKATAFYVSPGDALFSPVMSGKPVESLLLSIGSRTLFGLVMGLLYQWARNAKHDILGILLVTSLGRIVHAVLVYGFMEMLFPEAGFRISNVAEDFLRWDYPAFLLMADGLVCLCYRINRSNEARRFWQRVREVDRMNVTVDYTRKRTVLMVGLACLASISVALYFVNRIETVMVWHGLQVPLRFSYDLFHLQIQLLLGTVSLAALVSLTVILHLKKFSYLYYEARLDGLTGLMRRKEFFQAAKERMEKTETVPGEETGFFIILDVDSFKEINDRFGHPTGDRVLKETGQHLKDVFDDKGIVGRLGGDEFVVLVCCPMTRNEMENLLKQFRREISRIRIPKGTVTCSIGVTPVKEGLTIEELYRSADQLLYEAKKKGKNQFAFGYRLKT